MTSTNATDVLVVGGGPAGLAAALALRLRGAQVTVADAIKPPIDKACGEGLMPDARRELAALGVEFEERAGGAFRGIRFASYSTEGALGNVATAPFPTGRTFGDGIGLGVQRRALHLRLAEQAAEAGVDLRWGQTVQLQAGRQVLVGGEAANYGLLVGADGQGSRVRRWAGLEAGRVLSRRFGFRRHYRVEPWSPNVEVHWGRTGQAYVTPVGANEICVATIARDPHCRLENMLEQLPWLKEKLSGRESGPVATDAERGALTTTRRLRAVVRGRVALIGDASGSADAITGEGMAMAFRQALLLAECAEADDLPRYNRLHPKILELPQTMARVMLLMDRSGLFRERAIGLLSARPELFRRMLGVHVGAESLGRFVAAKGLELAWRLAVPAYAAPAEA